MFLRYTITTKQYQLYDPSTKVILSRNVEFAERLSYSWSVEPASEGVGVKGPVFYHRPSEVKQEALPAEGLPAVPEPQDPVPGEPVGAAEPGQPNKSEQSKEEKGLDREADPVPKVPNVPNVLAPHEKDTREQKRSFPKELELTEGTVHWDAPGGSRWGRSQAGGQLAGDMAHMVMDGIMNVEKGPATCKRAMETDEADN
jgi:hypothetical protein